jgi:sarcosine oxidase
VPADRRCIVVGAGLLGLSAAWVLARRGWDVVVLEAAGAVGHDRSGSKGDARIFRLGYPDPLYVEMALRARSLWQDLERAAGRQLLHATGQLTFGDEAALETIAEALAAVGVPAERLTAAEAAVRFEGIAARGTVLCEPASGVLAADECLRALCDTGRFGLRTGVAVRTVRERPHGAHVTTADGRSYDADVVLVCAGPRSLALVGENPAVVAAPSLPQVAFFRPKSGTAGMVALPVLIEWGDAMIYGLPVPGGGPHAGTYKVSHHTPGTALEGFDPTGPEPFADDASLLGTLSGAVARLLPALDPDPAATERCVYDNAVDTDFVLDRVGHVVVGCGTSGHGFKFGPLLGEILAALADGSDPPVDLGRFGLRREVAG